MNLLLFQDRARGEFKKREGKKEALTRDACHSNSDDDDDIGRVLVSIERAVAQIVDLISPAACARVRARARIIFRK